MNSLLLENNHCLLKLQWEIWWKYHCQRIILVCFPKSGIKSYSLIGFFLSMLYGCNLVWSSTLEDIDFLLLENHPCLLKLQWKIWWKGHCQRRVGVVNLQLGSWKYKDCEALIYNGVYVWWDDSGSAKEVIGCASVTRLQMELAWSALAILVMRCDDEQNCFDLCGLWRSSMWFPAMVLRRIWRLAVWFFISVRHVKVS